MPRGRPLAITPEKAQLIVDALRNRNVKEASAAIADVHRDTLYESLRRGRRVSEALRGGARRRDFTRNDLRLAEFSDAVARALAEAEVQTITLIGRAGQSPSVERKVVRKYVGLDANQQPIYATEETTTEKPPDWRALAWIAERRWDDWAPVSRQEHSGPGGGPIPIERRVETLLGRVVELKRSPKELSAGDDSIDVEAREA